MFKNLSFKKLKKEYLESEKVVDANMKKASEEFDKLHKQNEIESAKIKKRIEKYLY
ncbi:hypothetical protein [Lactobacillus bombicola]|uniref:hypothetical protein n=1 Tax=Lactobacillus bombicola TaxID=1505723 RepID=UPI0015FE3F5F|nr:hypothetical protein [Lactobacillus bombicola]